MLRRAGGVASYLDRSPFNSPWIRQVVSRWGLGFWFALVSVPTLVVYLTSNPDPFFDAQLYLAATRTWLDGGNPWTVARREVFFGAPPPTLVLLVPFAMLPADVGWIVLGIICAAGAVATIRVLSLPWWWLLFPPTVTAVLAGNIQTLLVPLILIRVGWAAGLLKVYAAVPEAILGRWRSVAIFLVLTVLTGPLLPWQTFLASLGSVAGSFVGQSRYGISPTVSGLLAPVALAAMWVIGRERSAWLAVPALWPWQQWYYATLALPARSKIAAFVISLPFAASGTIALFVLAAAELVNRRRTRSRTSAHLRMAEPLPPGPEPHR
jgi:hypothetical protein